MRVLLAIPTAGTIHWKLLNKIVDICKDERHEVELLVSKMVGNEANRNAITKDFLKGDYDYLLMIDTDNPPLENPLDMIDHDKDIVSIPTPINLNILEVNNFFWNIFDETTDPKYPTRPRKLRGEGLENVYAVGTGCILVKRKVLEAIKNPFLPVRNDDDSRKWTQDIVFCMRARAEGFEVWADWDKRCMHYKEIDLLTLI